MLCKFAAWQAAGVQGATGKAVPMQNVQSTSAADAQAPRWTPAAWAAYVNSWPPCCTAGPTGAQLESMLAEARRDPLGHEIRTLREYVQQLGAEQRVHVQKCGKLDPFIRAEKRQAERNWIDARRRLRAIAECATDFTAADLGDDLEIQFLRQRDAERERQRKQRLTVELFGMPHRVTRNGKRVQ